MVYVNNKYCLSFQKFTMNYPESILLDTHWCAKVHIFQKNIKVQTKNPTNVELIYRNEGMKM